MDTPILSRIRPDVKALLAESVPNPPRLGRPEEFAQMALSIIGNRYLNGETIRLTAPSGWPRDERSTGNGRR